MLESIKIKIGSLYFIYFFGKGILYKMSLFAIISDITIKGNIDGIITLPQRSNPFIIEIFTFWGFNKKRIAIKIAVIPKKIFLSCKITVILNSLSGILINYYSYFILERRCFLWQKKLKSVYKKQRMKN